MNNKIIDKIISDIQENKVDPFTEEVKSSNGSYQIIAEESRSYLNNRYYCLRCGADVIENDGPKCKCVDSPSPWALKPKLV